MRIINDYDNYDVYGNYDAYDNYNNYDNHLFILLDQRAKIAATSLCVPRVPPQIRISLKMENFSKIENNST